MKEEYVNSFLAPTKLVWEKELGQTLELAGIDLVSNQFTTDDVTAVIGVSGRLE
jgi:CheY-specific phosphatase CheX